MKRKSYASGTDGVPRKLLWAGFILGVALSGMFDAILLQQILQWHHLLSLVPTVTSPAEHMFYNGLFMAAMYVLFGAALWLFWDARQYRRVTGSTRTVRAMALVGFGTWTLADAVIAHWLLGIHRIKIDAPDPLAWDLLWVALFGIVPLAAGWLLRPGTVYGQGSRARTPG